MQRPQMLVFCYHKSGTVLLSNVFRAIAAPLGLTVAERYGMVRGVETGFDVVIFGHAMLGFALGRSFRAVRVVRDPRDIWVSGYLYHCHCEELWCTNTDFDPSPPITWPRVPLQLEHRRERWKRDYLARLGGRSYQANLLERDRDAGLEFDLEGYTAVTMEDMRAWQLSSPDLLEVKLETIAQDFDATMRTIFYHLGFTEAEIPVVMEAAAKEDIGRMDDAAIAANPHIHSREISKWRRILSPEQVRRFEQRYGDVILRLGYELSTQGSIIG